MWRTTAQMLMFGCVLGLALPACDQCCDAGGDKARADGCDCTGGESSDGDKPAAAPGERGEPDAKYTVRGRVEMVPVAGKPQTEFVAHHEAIPDFKRFDGKLGMNEMSMPFPPAKDLDLSAIAIGDIVEIEFAVWSKPGNLHMEARKVTKLPPDTKLNLKGG